MTYEIFSYVTFHSLSSDRQKNLSTFDNKLLSVLILFERILEHLKATNPARAEIFQKKAPQYVKNVLMANFKVCFGILLLK